MSFNIATFSAKFGITDSVDTDFSRILSTIDRHSQSAADKLSNPIAALDRQAQMLEKSLDKTINKFGTGLVSEKALSDLEKMQTYVQNIYRQLSETGKIGDQGFLQAIQRLQTLQHGIDVARNIAVPSPSAFAALQNKAIAPAASAMPVSNTYSQFVGAESVYTMPAGFGPIKFGGNAYVDSNSANRHAVAARRDRAAYEQWWQNQQIAPQTTSHFVPNSDFGMPAGFGPVKFGGSAYVDNDARNRHAVAARRDRAAYEQWWQNQQIAPQTTSRFVPNSDFGMPAGFGPIDLATDLTSQMDYAAKRQSVIARNAGIIINRHQKEFGTPEEQQFRADMDQRMINRQAGAKFDEVAAVERRSAQLRLSKDLEVQYRQEARELERLTRLFSGMSKQEREAHNLTLRAQSTAGMVNNGVGNIVMQQRAMEEVSNPFSQFNQKTGRGSFSHAFRYGSQNAAFALEDFLIASQYGGAKAGFRAITNNLTAIASAATSGMNPLIGAGVIGATAIGGASAPFLVNAFTGANEQSEELIKQQVGVRSGTMFAHEAQIFGRRSVGSGTSSARQAYQDAQDSITAFEMKKADILRSISPETRRLAGQKTSYTERFLAGASNAGMNDAYGNPGLVTQTIAGAVSWADYFAGNQITWNRSPEQLRRIDEARSIMENANKNISGLGDPELMRQRQEQARQLLDQERNREQADFAITNRFAPERYSLAGRAARGELVDPSLAYNISNQERNARLAQARKDYADQPERLKDIITQNERDQTQADAKHVHDMEMYAFNKQQQQFGFQQSMLSLDPNQLRKEEKAYQLRRQMTMQDASLTQSQKDEQLAGLEADYNYRVKQRGYAHESRMTDYEIRPIERMRKQYELRRKMLSEDSSLTQAQRDSELAGLDKQYQRSIRDIGERAPTLMGMDVGSLSDVANRNKYFNRNPTMEDGQRSFSEQLLRQVIEAINNQTLEMKKNKTPVKGFK